MRTFFVLICSFALVGVVRGDTKKPHAQSKMLNGRPGVKMIEQRHSRCALERAVHGVFC
jgi:hypothetical protein